jgi:hypothetical protein
VGTRPLVLVALALSCAPSGDPARSAIAKGAPDSGDPAVVALIDGADATWCSGALIGPHTVLTAAHCLADPFDPRQYRVFFGSSLASGGVRAQITRASIHPGFDRMTLKNDFGVVTIRPAAVPAPLLLDSRTPDASWVGQSFQTVGFGFTAPNGGDAGDKRSGTAKVASVIEFEFATAAASPQACTFDSGGPALFMTGGNTVIAGVASHGDAACADHTAYARIDVARTSFIAPALAADANQSASVGDRCYHDDQCKTGPCLVTSDDPHLSFCSQPCADASACPAPMECAAGSCRYPTPSPGAFGAACDTNAACEGSTCYVAPNKRGVCTRRCNPLAPDCPGDFMCQNDTGTAFYCTPPSTGCAIGGPSAAPRWPVLLLMMVGCWLLRRRLSA